uniref:Uncharacterized protein n=1 Tax=Anguilla anguilla TaxID=7936 RepID=A0A0E9ULJ4_ANGAN
MQSSTVGQQLNGFTLTYMVVWILVNIVNLL